MGQEGADEGEGRGGGRVERVLIFFGEVRKSGGGRGDEGGGDGDSLCDGNSHRERREKGDGWLCYVIRKDGL